MDKGLHEPFEIDFGDFYCTINRRNGGFFFFPKLKEFCKDGMQLNFETNYNYTEVHDKEIPDHVSFHKDGTIHMKYCDSGKLKTKINKLGKPLAEITKNEFVPMFSFSTRITKDVYSVICLIAGNDVLDNIELLPKPYSLFIINNKKNDHVFTVRCSENNLNFGYLFIHTPVFLPHNYKGFSSFMVPPKEEHLTNAYNNMPTNSKMHIECLLG